MVFFKENTKTIWLIFDKRAEVEGKLAEIDKSI